MSRIININFNYLLIICICIIFVLILHFYHTLLLSLFYFLPSHNFSRSYFLSHHFFSLTYYYFFISIIFFSLLLILCYSFPTLSSILFTFTRFFSTIFIPFHAHPFSRLFLHFCCSIICLSLRTLSLFMYFLVHT